MTVVGRSTPIRDHLHEKWLVEKFAVLVVMLLTACTEHTHQELQIEGMTKEQVLHHLGNPTHKTLLNGRQINNSMGPKPNLAANMSDESEVVMWHFPVTDDRSAQVYFDDDGIVTEVIVFQTDVMY